MYPDDRVLVGVINRKGDLNRLLQEQWYRIPQPRMPHGIYVEYLAFYISGSAARHLDGAGIYYYAQRRGVELAYRRDLLPKEADHPRANDVYYKVQLDPPVARIPIRNPSKRSISFIWTTWDRFIKAETIADLYSQTDYFVDRIYHALRDRQIRVDRYWDAQKRETGHGAGLRILCENGSVEAFTERQAGDGVYYLDVRKSEDDVFEEIYRRIASMGGPVTLPISPSS